MAQDIIIYGEAGWPYTEKARSVYTVAQYFDVKQDHEKLDEMLQLSKGVRKVPVIVEGEKVAIGYGGSWGVWSRWVIGQNHKTTNNTRQSTWLRLLDKSQQDSSWPAG